MMSRRRIVAVVIGLVALMPLLSAAPAQAGPGFELATSAGGRFRGHAEAGGRFIWHADGKHVSIYIGRLADICPADGAGAYLYISLRRGHDQVGNYHVANDDSGCSDGNIVAGKTIGPFSATDQVTIGSAQLTLVECDYDGGHRYPCSADPLDNVDSEWKWNPYR